MYKFRQFKEQGITGGEMYDILQKYNLTNCTDMYTLAEILAEDYNLQRINIIPLLKKGMNARVLMELRICCIIKATSDFFDGLFKGDYTTVDEIVEYRKCYYAKNNRLFTNAVYENYWLMFLSLDIPQRKNLEFDFEYLYEDCDNEHVITSEITSEIENKAGFVYLRNTKEEYPKEDFRRLVARLQRDTDRWQEIRNKPVRFVDMPPIYDGFMCDEYKD